MKYRTLVTDPPWQERGGGKSKRGADRHYPLMSTTDIIDTMADALDMDQHPMLIHGRREYYPTRNSTFSKEGCHLWCWVTDNFLEDGLRVISALGFRYVRTMVWVKCVQGETSVVIQKGLGQYLRGAHELCLLGVRGDAMLPEPADRMPSVVFAPRGKHSAKPQAAFDVIEKTSPGPRLEMFARQPRDGWSVWGNEVDCG